MSSSKNNLIAKNTMMLYIRLSIVMIVYLYTSRIVLKALGIEDYGIYNVVAGVITLFSFYQRFGAFFDYDFYSKHIGLSTSSGSRAASITSDMSLT